MALKYIYAKSEDTHKIKNIGPTPLSYIISTFDCEEKVLFKTGEILTDQTVILPINYIDSIYSLELSDGIESEEFSIHQYNNLLKSIIYNIEEVVCGCDNCGCSDCNDVDPCGLSLNTLISIFSYFFVVSPSLNSYVEIIGEYLKCDIKADVLCYISKQQINGEQDTQDLYYKIIGVYYAAFYYSEFAKATTPEERAFVSMKYKFLKIAKCLKKVGVDLSDIEEAFADYPVYYWQLDNPVDGVQEVINTLSFSLLATKPVASMKVFNEGKTIRYVNVGRVVFVVKNAEAANFAISDYLGDDVTSQFDSYYDETKKLAVYVLKSYTSHADLYFKFKQY